MSEVDAVIYLFRFFVVAPPVAPLMVATFVLLAAVAAAVVVVDDSRAATAVTPVIVLQSFASASGFEGPARRGHYDLLLTCGEGRLRVALAHWLVSVAPGAAACGVIGLVEVTVSGGSRHAVFSSGTSAALLLVSTLSWAMAVRLPRFAPSIGWVLLLVMVPTVLSVETVDAALRMAAEGSPGSAAAAAFLLYPVSVVGQHLRPGGALIVAPGLAAAAVAMLTAIRWIARADFPLEAGQ
jgi:hypothetical protein